MDRKYFAETAEAKLYIRNGLDVFNLIFFLTWPLAALINAIRNYRSFYSINIIWLFCIFFGAGFVISDGSLADSSRISQQLDLMANSDISLNVIISSLYVEGSNELDIVQSVIIFLVAQFTSDSRILYAIFGLLFGFFYSRNIWFLIERYSFNLRIYSILVLITFVLVNPIWNINGFRFYFAVQVFIYGLFPFIYDKDKTKLWFSAFSILIHWSFIFPVIILILYALTNNKTRIFYYLFFLSFFISLIEIDQIKILFERLAPNAVQESRSSYFNEAYRESINESTALTNWYVQGHETLMKWFLFLSMTFIYKKKQFLYFENKSILNLYNLTLLFFIFVNTFSIVPSISRFYNIAYLLALSLIFLTTQFENLKMAKIYEQMCIIPIGIYLIVKFRFGFDYMGIQHIFGNALNIFIFESNTPLIDLVKKFIL